MVVQLMEVFKVSDTYISCSNNGIGVCIASMTKQQLKSCDAHCDTASNLEFDKVCILGYCKYARLERNKRNENI